MDVIPNENLPAPAMAWGKDMTNWRRETQRMLERTNQDTNNTLSSLNASVQLLSTQVRDVIGRTDRFNIAAPSALNFQGAFGTRTGLITDGIYPHSFTFTNTDARKMSITVETSVYLGPRSSWFHSFYIDDILIADGHPSLVDGSDPGWSSGYSAGDNGSANPGVFIQVTSVGMADLYLKAGTHTISVNYTAQGALANSWVAAQESAFRLSTLGIA